jgi:hypothetical protein
MMSVSMRCSGSIRWSLLNYILWAKRVRNWLVNEVAPSYL